MYVYMALLNIETLVHGLHLCIGMNVYMVLLNIEKLVHDLVSVWIQAFMYRNVCMYGLIEYRDARS
jgi:hypothetical protein